MKKAPHLFASIVAILGAILAAVLFTTYTKRYEQKYIHPVAQLDHHEVLKGNVLQHLAIKQDDLLMMYGSSEMVLIPSDYAADKFFKNYPTGFMVFEVANKGTSMLSMAQDIASLGPDLRGKKIVVSFAPATITMAPGGEMNADNYDPNFSELHALELSFSSYISWETKQMAAKRMLDYPNTLAERPFLKFTLEALADGSTLGKLKYYLAWPLGRLQIAFIHIQDHYAVWDYIRHQSSEDLKVTRKQETIDWNANIADARAEQIDRSSSNTFGVDDTRWARVAELVAVPAKPGSKDQQFITDVKNAAEWQDMKILLRIVNELGGRPLMLGRPINATFWETIGVSQEAQNTYYQILHETVAPYGYPVVDFHEYRTDKYFSADMASHSSPEGWMYVNQTLDAFFHDTLH